ncbi:glycine betaine ABC transporter substrate-binding protein [Pontibacillus sp. ALD_SL1]|uniref:glycine betaine ABC transporter substrate-binding protein n=1 Tax=Pontibacillus sp. ALD_SL1 TaxID=2777185 RepID=UPI001A971B43|nr:glycine betaine ABC transporter substrate-binding protein [Pontibacillus sp. ALD_SL1]QSS99481.1 glycine betaine ABC transporter substrate-binding protein [Pontibacillus sp. ALD_SL1]
MKALKRILPALFIGMLLVLAGCGDSSSSGSEEGSDESSKTIELGLNNWAENVAVSNMWKVILEDEGYTVNLNMTEKGPLYQALKSDDLDVALEVWLPHTDKPFYEDFKNDVDFHKDQTWFEGTILGLAVPSYVDVNSIEELNENKEMFEDGKIYGIDAGSSLMGLTEDVIKEYDLDYSTAASSGPAMTTQLGESIRKEEPILVTLWKPHWVFAEYDVKFLEDPKNVYGDEENISWMSRQGFTEDYPEVTEYINTWKMNDEQLGSLMNMVKEAEAPADGAQKWVDENEDLINEWLGK